jgi:hypothetical protein
MVCKKRKPTMRCFVAYYSLTGTTTLVAAAFVLCSGFALISDDISGIVRSIDRSTRQVLLEDGKSYTIARGIDLAKFTAGETARIFHFNIATPFGKVFRTRR